MKKTITFQKYSSLPRRGAVDEYIFPYTVVDSSLIDTPEERVRTEQYSIKVGATYVLLSHWNLIGTNLIKVLFEYGKRHIIQKLKDGTLSQTEELLLSTSTAEMPCIFDPARISFRPGETFEVDLDNVPIMSDQTFLKLASSIIDTRDNINAIFSSIHKEKLILLNEERDLVQFFKDVVSQEEFCFRLCAMANASTSLNIPILRKITGISDKNVKTISLLEQYLNIIGAPPGEIIKTLRYINKIRQGYPVHGDYVEGVLEKLKFFNIEYPIIDFSISWRNLLVKYLNALKILLDILKEKL